MVDRLRSLAVVASVALAAVTGCSPPASEAPAATAGSGATAAGDSLPPPQSVLPEEVRGLIDRPFTGDFDELVSRRVIRAGVPFNRTFYFVDKGSQRGLSYEYLMLFEDALNKKLKTRNLKLHIVLLPLSAEALLPALRAGMVDMVVAQFTVTPARQELVDFTVPTRHNVNEIVVTGPGAPPVGSVDDMSGREVFVRRSSSYYESLMALNATLQAKGRLPVDIQLAAENLEDDDLLEMVNAGLIPTTVVDNYLAEFWKQVFTEHHAAPTGHRCEPAVRSPSPFGRPIRS